MVAHAIPFAVPAVNDNFAGTPIPRLAVHKDRPGDLPQGIRLERWASRLQGRV